MEIFSRIVLCDFISRKNAGSAVPFAPAFYVP
jgi:hypothetical protein